jgi:hypothetical protein
MESLVTLNRLKPFALYLLGVIAAAQSPTPRALVEAGVTAYMQEGAGAAIKAWMKGGYLDGNQEMLSQANIFNQIESFSGKPEGFDIIAEQPLAPRAKIIYFIINMQKGPLFCKFQVYEKRPGGWVTNRVDFNTEASKIIPKAMVENVDPPK